MGKDLTIKGKVPDMSLELAPEYPRAWFASHPDVKPPLRIPSQTKEELLKWMGNLWASDAEIEPSFSEFLYEHIKKNFKEKLVEGWISYNRVINRKGDEITPFDPYDVDVQTYDLGPQAGHPLPPEEEDARAAIVLSIYRACISIQPLGGYKAEVIATMKNAQEPPFNLKFMDSEAIIAKTHGQEMTTE